MDDKRTDDEAADQPEQEAIEHTEETGEIDPSSLWPEGDEDTRTPA